jgi:hypothetical protein
MYYIIIDISFIFCFLGISLLYKDNDPYVVIGIYFHFMFVLYVIIYHRLGDKDYH